jgi:hypothetical protein
LIIGDTTPPINTTPHMNSEKDIWGVITVMGNAPFDAVYVIGGLVLAG